MSNLFVKRQYKSAKDIEEEFFYQDELNSVENKVTDTGNNFLGKHLSENKLTLFFILIVFSLVVFLGRTGQLQIAKGSYYQQLAEINRTRHKPLISSRGLIYDQKMRPLVKNIPIFEAVVLPKELAFNQEIRREQILKISELLKINEQDIYSVIDKYPPNFNYYLTIKDNIGYDQAMLLKIQAQQINGLYINTRNQREYIYPEMFSHLLGYLGKITDSELQEHAAADYLFNDYIGKIGLEYYYENELRGQYGEEEVEVNVSGQEVKINYRQEPVSGKNLKLSIDMTVQDKVRQILENYMQKINKTKASIVLLNPNNGEVISLISWPDYNINLFAKGISQTDYENLLNNEAKPLFNRAIKGEYPSGSTIKPVVAAGALQEGIVTANTSFLSTGGLWLYDRWFFPDWSAGGHGQTNIYKAIAWSVNTYFYIIGGGYEDFQGLGVEGLDKYYKLFGLGHKTGLDMSGESSGLVPDPAWKMNVKDEEWFIGDTYHLAIGQGDLLVTPLQVANYTAVFANNGTLYTPHLVVEEDLDSGEKQVIAPEIIRQNFIDPENINIVRTAMRQTVTLGSAQYLDNLNITSAGKTGTAQWSSTKDNHAWYTGFAPYENPEVVITVLIEEGGEGSQIAVPLVYQILDWYFAEYLPSNESKL